MVSLISRPNVPIVIALNKTDTLTSKIYNSYLKNEATIGDIDQEAVLQQVRAVEELYGLPCIATTCDPSFQKLFPISSLVTI